MFTPSVFSFYSHIDKGTFRKKQCGLVALEFAIVAPIFYLLLFVILDGGRMIMAYNSVAHASKQAVRYTVVRGAEAAQDNLRFSDAPATDAQVNTYLQNLFVSLELRVITTWPVNRNAGQVVTITVEHDFDPVTPFLPSMTLTSTSSTVIYY